MPSLGFLSLGIVGLRSVRIRRVAWVLLAYSVVTMLVAAAVGPEPPTEADPVLGHYWSMVLDNQVATRQVGDQIPDAEVWIGPNQPARLRELVETGPKLLLFYLFDWSST